MSVSELSKRLGISLSTVRSDLIDLENIGIAVRSRGGAGPCRTRTLTAVAAESSRAANRHAEQKQKIGVKAAELVQDSGCIVLDAGHDDPGSGQAL